MGIYLVVQWLKLPTSTAGDMDPIPDQGTRIPICPTALQNFFFFKSKSACGMGEIAAAMFGIFYLLEIDYQVI